MLVTIYFSHCQNCQTSVFVFFFLSLCSFILHSVQRQERAVDCNKITNYMLEETWLFFPAAVIWCCGEQRQRAGVMWHSLCPLSSLITVYPSQLKVARALHPFILPEKPHRHVLTQKYALCFPLYTQLLKTIKYTHSHTQIVTLSHQTRV